MMRISQVKSLMKKNSLESDTSGEENELDFDMSGEENGLDSDMSDEDNQNSGENHMSYQASLTSLTSSSSSSSLEDNDSDQDYAMITRYFRSSMEYVDISRLVISAAPTKKCSAYSFISQDNQPNGSTKLYGFYPGL